MPDEIAIDYPDEVVHWDASYPESERKRPVIGECPHPCRHRLLRLAGWGPDLAHYTLKVCKDPEGCRGDCRGWCGPATYARVKTIDWKLLAPPGPATPSGTGG